MQEDYAFFSREIVLPFRDKGQFRSIYLPWLDWASPVWAENRPCWNYLPQNSYNTINFKFEYFESPKDIFRHGTQFFRGHYSHVAWMFSWRICLCRFVSFQSKGKPLMLWRCPLWYFDYKQESFESRLGLVIYQLFECSSRTSLSNILGRSRYDA